MNEIVIAGLVGFFLGGFGIIYIFHRRSSSLATMTMSPPRHNWQRLAQGPPLRATSIRFAHTTRRVYSFSLVSVVEVCQWFDETLKCSDAVQAYDKFYNHSFQVYIKCFPNTKSVPDPEFCSDFKQTVAEWVPYKHPVELCFRFVGSPFQQQHVELYGVRHGVDCTCSGNNYCRRLPSEHLIARIYCKTMWRVVEIVMALSSLDLPGYVLLWIIDFLPGVAKGWKEIDKITLITNVINSVRQVREKRGQLENE